MTSNDRSQHELQVNTSALPGGLWEKLLEAIYRSYLNGGVRPGAYEVTDMSKRFFIVEKPTLRGIEFHEEHDELSILKTLDYFIVAKQRLSYIYDFNE